MKTTSGWFHLRGLLFLSVAFAFGSVLETSELAGPSSYRDLPATKASAVQEKPAPKKVAVYVQSSCSAIPIPIDRVSNSIPTTATPMIVIGNYRDHQSSR